MRASVPVAAHDREQHPLIISGEARAGIDEMYRELYELAFFLGILAHATTTLSTSMTARS